MKDSIKMHGCFFVMKMSLALEKHKFNLPFDECHVLYIALLFYNL